MKRESRQLTQQLKQFQRSQDKLKSQRINPYTLDAINVMKKQTKNTQLKFDNLPRPVFQLDKGITGPAIIKADETTPLFAKEKKPNQLNIFTNQEKK